jgi:hypothetical protein
MLSELSAKLRAESERVEELLDRMEESERMGDEETLEEVLIELGECEEREQLIWRSMQGIRPEVCVPSPVPPVPAPRTRLSLRPINTGVPSCPALPELPLLSNKWQMLHNQGVEST